MEITANIRQAAERLQTYAAGGSLEVIFQRRLRVEEYERLALSLDDDRKLLIDWAIAEILKETTR